MKKFAIASIVTLAAAASAQAATYSTDFESPTFSTGSINGQDGWTVANPNFNQAVSTGDAHSGTQSWFRSNTYGVSSFSDQPFSAPLPGGAKSGESTAVGATDSSNSYSVWFKAATTAQDGSFVALSLSNSGGSRMNWIGLDNNDAAGLRLTATDGNFDEFDLGAVSRTAWHQLTVATTFLDGPGNDVVNYFIDGVLKQTLSSWEDYYRFDPEQAGNGNLVPASDRVLFRTSAGVADPTAAGFYFDDFSVTTAVPEPTALAAVAGAAVLLLGRRRRRQA